MKRPLIFAGTAVVLFGLIAAFIWLKRTFNGEHPGLEIRAKMVVGHELRLITETYRSYSPFYSHSTTTKDAKGWFIIVDLNSSKPLPERSQIFGPLWDVANPRSILSFNAGAYFTQADIDAANATPSCSFDALGTLIRYVRDSKREVVVRYDFLPSRQGGTWKRVSETKVAPGSLQQTSENILTTPSGQFILSYLGGQAKLVDRLAGADKPDEWLSNCFAQVHSIKNFENVRYFLTDDLNYLVVRPEAIWNTGRGPIISTFEFGGTTYNRADVGLAYSRPDPTPQIFQRAPNPSFLDQEPHGAFSINGRLYLFMHDTKSLRLYTPDGKTEFRLTATSQPDWPTYSFVETQHLAAENQLVLFGSDDLGREVGLHEVSVNIWNYKSGTMAHKVAPLNELFESSWGQLRPISSTLVK